MAAARLHHPQHRTAIVVIRRYFSLVVALAILMNVAHSCGGAEAGYAGHSRRGSPPHTAVAATATAAPSDPGSDDSNPSVTEGRKAPRREEDSVVPLLPAADPDSNLPSIQLGETLSFEQMGPVIINADGTTRRISNWDQLTLQEQQTTWRRIKKRNAERRNKLLEQQHQQQQRADEEASAGDREL